jgi:hypothetical protein
MDMVFKYQNKKDLEEVNNNILKSFHGISTAKVLKMIRHVLHDYHSLDFQQTTIVNNKKLRPGQMIKEKKANILI